MAERQLCPTDLQINGAGLVPALTLTQRLRRPAAGYRMEEEEGDRRGQGRQRLTIELSPKYQSAFVVESYTVNGWPRTCNKWSAQSLRRTSHPSTTMARIQ